MNPSELTCSKANGEALAKLGVTVESYFKWCWYDISPLTGRATEPGLTNDAFKFHGESRSPAWTVGEIGAMLPTEVGKYILCLVKSQGGWVVCYEDSSFKRLQGVGIFNPSEADARALMLIWLLEQGHITKEEINGEG